METASFFTPGLDWQDRRLVSIARWPPRGWKGRRYKALYPSIYLLTAWKEKCIGLPKLYEAWYRAETLRCLDAKQVVADLGTDAILLCYEKPGEMCHRRLVAEWLERATGLLVPELGT